MDIQSAVAQRAGVGRYTAQLCTSLAPLMRPQDGHQLRLFSFDFKGKGGGLVIPGTTQRTIRWCPGRVAQRLWRHLRHPSFDRFSGPADCFHFPNFVMPPLRRGKAVVTIHDMSFARFPQFADTKNAAYLKSELHSTVARADAIITVSRFSAGEIAELLPLSPDRIFPIPLGISEVFAPPPPETTARQLAALGIDRPYILAVGTLEPRKNIPFLIGVFEALKDFDGLLVLAGAPGWKYEPILERIRLSPAASRIRRLNHVSDETLPSLYAGAALFVIPSFYEGFGFPPLEAMACGTPVLASSGGSLPEMLEGAAHIMPDFAPDAWTHAVQELLTDTDRRADCRARGLRHAARFRWSTTARQTFDLYRQVTGKP